MPFPFPQPNADIVKKVAMEDSTALFKKALNPNLSGYISR
jgi:hypothetical protein